MKHFVSRKCGEFISDKASSSPPVGAQCRCGDEFLLLQLVVRIEFDPRKDEINRAKHGVLLTIAAEMDLEAALIEPDRRLPYGEVRFQAIAPIAGRPHLLVITMRGDVVRVISLRKANGRKRRRYEQKT